MGSAERDDGSEEFEERVTSGNPENPPDYARNLVAHYGDEWRDWLDEFRQVLQNEGFDVGPDKARSLIRYSRSDVNWERFQADITSGDPDTLPDYARNFLTHYEDRWRDLLPEFRDVLLYEGLDIGPEKVRAVIDYVQEDLRRSQHVPEESSQQSGRAVPKTVDEERLRRPKRDPPSSGGPIPRNSEKAVSGIRDRQIAVQAPFLKTAILWFALVGVGMGLGAIVMIWSVGIENPLMLGFTAITSVFLALPIGLVLAALVGLHVARSDRTTRTEATKLSGIAGSIGHVVLVIALALVLIFGLAILSSGSGTGGGTQAGAEGAAQGGGPSVPWDTVGKMVLGLVPAGLVGAGTAYLFSSRP